MNGGQGQSANHPPVSFSGIGGCGVETRGGFSMKSAVHLRDRLKEVRGGVFPGTEDGTDE
jgi:hypothetical protein